MSHTIKRSRAVLAYLRKQCEETDVVKEARKKRPLLENDKLFRSTFILDGVAHMCSVVARANGRIEVWVQHYNVDDATPINDPEILKFISNADPSFDPELDSVFVTDTTHAGFTLATILPPKSVE